MINLPEGWGIKSNESVLKAHGNFGYELNYSLCFSEKMDFADEVPEDVQKSAKPGKIYENKLTNNVLQQGNDKRWRPLNISDEAKAKLNNQRKLRALNSQIKKLTEEMVPFYASYLTDRYKKETLKKYGIPFSPEDKDYPKEEGTEKVNQRFGQVRQILDKIRQLDPNANIAGITERVKQSVIGRAEQLHEQQKENISWGQYEKAVKQVLKEKEQGGTDTMLGLEKAIKEADEDQKKLIEETIGGDSQAQEDRSKEVTEGIEDRNIKKELQYLFWIVAGNISDGIKYKEKGEELNKYVVESCIDNILEINMYLKELGEDGDEARSFFENLIKVAKIKGLQNLLPEEYKDKKISGPDDEKEEEHIPEEIPEKEQNAGYMLNDEYRYEPETTIEDLPDWIINRFRIQAENFDELLERGFREKYKQFKNCSGESLMAIFEYSSDDFFYRVNNLARGRATRDTLNSKAKTLDTSSVEDELDYGADYLIPLLDTALEEMQLNKSETLYRGVSSDSLRKAFSARQVGDIIYDHGYFSTSPSIDIARKFGKTVLFKIEDAIGYQIDASSAYKHESERIFPRGTAFEITEMKRKGGRLEITLSHLPSDSEMEKYRKQFGE